MHNHRARVSINYYESKEFLSEELKRANERMNEEGIDEYNVLVDSYVPYLIIQILFRWDRSLCDIKSVSAKGLSGWLVVVEHS